MVVATASGDLGDVTHKQEAFAGLPVLLMLWGLVGAGEYRHRTAAPTAVAVPTVTGYS